jgi:O-antigen ligase
MVAHLLWVAVEYVRVGSISPHFSSFTDHKANVTYAACTLLPIVLAFAVVRGSYAETANRSFPSVVWVAGILAVTAVITSGARNGVIVMFIAVAMAGSLVVGHISRANFQKRYQIIAACLFVAIVVGIGWAGFKWDSRWQRFVQTVPVALDTETHLEWLDKPGSPLPITADGRPAEESAYQRIAWAKIGIGLLLDHPWGLEISRNTFHRLIVERYGRGWAPHAHNSIIDFGLNAGIPGLILWFSFVGALVIAGWRVRKGEAAVVGWALIFLVLMYVTRSLIDSIMRDHILEQFMLASGLLLGAMDSIQANSGDGSR